MEVVDQLAGGGVEEELEEGLKVELKLDLFEIGGAGSRVDDELEGGGGGDKTPKEDVEAFPLLRFELGVLPRGEGLMVLVLEEDKALLTPLSELELPV